MKEELVNPIKMYNRPEITLKCFQSDVKLKDLDNEELFYPLSGSEYVLLSAVFCNAIKKLLCNATVAIFLASWVTHVYLE